MRRKRIITLILIVILVALFAYGDRVGNRRKHIVYRDSLDKVAAVVGDDSLTLRDLAFYVAYEEEQVEKQARAYDAEDTSKYWNLHVDGMYIRVAARNAAMQMAIHDALFYNLAEKDDMELDEKEVASFESAFTDTWNDMVDEQKDIRLGVSKEDIYQAMFRMACAQKYQSIYAQMMDVRFEDFNFDGERYKEWLETQPYEIKKNVWGAVDFGNVTLTHEE